MAARPTSLRLVAAPEKAEQITPIRRSVTLRRAAADLDCDESTVRRMLGKDLEGHTLRSGIRVYADSIEAYQRRNHIGPSEPAPARYTPPAVTETAEFRDILTGLHELGVLGNHESPPPAKRRRRA